MALLEIPINGQLPDQKFTIELDLVVYTFRIKRNDRSGRFYLDIKTEEEEMILAGVALVTNYAILSEFRDERLPKGNLFVTDITDRNEEPSEENFGKTVLLLYNEAS